MCLAHNISNSKNLSKVLPEEACVTVYKAFRIDTKWKYFSTCTRFKSANLTGIYRSGYKWTAGVHTAIPGVRNGYVYEGIHVCLTREEAVIIQEGEGGNDFTHPIIEFKVPVKNFSHVGTFGGVESVCGRVGKQAVLTQLTLTKEQVDGAINAYEVYLRAQKPKYFPTPRYASW